MSRITRSGCSRWKSSSASAPSVASTTAYSSARSANPTNPSSSRSSSTTSIFIAHSLLRFDHLDRLTYRQRNAQTSACSLALCRNLPAVPLDDGLGDPQPQSHAALLRLLARCPRESLKSREERRACSLWQSGPLILHATKRDC